MRSGRFVLEFLLWSAIAAAQQYVISTIAGGAPVPTPTPGLSLSVGTVYGIAAEPSGGVYFANSDQHSVFRLDPTGIVTRVAGNSRVGYSGDGSAAIDAQLSDPNGLAVDRAGNLFIADSGNRRIRRISQDGIITTVAGNGACCFSGDGVYYNRVGGSVLKPRTRRRREPVYHFCRPPWRLTPQATYSSRMPLAAAFVRSHRMGKLRP